MRYASTSLYALKVPIYGQQHQTYERDFGMEAIPGIKFFEKLLGLVFISLPQRLERQGNTGLAGVYRSPLPRALF